MARETDYGPRGTCKKGRFFGGVIQEGRLRLEIDLEDFEAYGPDYVAEYAKELGFHPVTAVAMHYGVGAQALAMSVAEEIRAAWVGRIVED